MTDHELEQAWADVHEHTPDGWYVGRPSFEHALGRWSMYAFDPSETPIVGKRSRECVAKGRTELDCVREMSRRLGELNIVGR